MLAFRKFTTTFIGLIVITILTVSCSGTAPAPPSETQIPSATSQAAAANPLPAASKCALALLLPGAVSDLPLLQQGVKEGSDKAGCRVDVSGAGNRPAAMVEQIQAASHNKVQGILIEPIADAAVEKAVQQAAAAGTPVIVLGADGLSSIQTNRVVPDELDGARKGADYICRALHERGSVVELRSSGLQAGPAFASQLQAKCPEVKLIQVPLQDSSEAAAQAALRQALSTSPDISAVFAYTLASMNGAIQALQQAGMLGVIIAGFGRQNAALGLVETGELTAFVQPSDRESGKAAALAALQQSSGAAAPPTILAAMELHTTDTAFQLPPDLTARRLTIGVVLPDAANPFDQKVYQGLISTARSLDNLTLKIRAAKNDPQVMLQELDWLVKARVDAILIAPMDSPALAPAVEAAIRGGTPVFTLGLAIQNQRIISQVRFDDYAAGYRAGETLCSAMGMKGTLADLSASQSSQQESVRSHGLADYLRDNCPQVKVIAPSLPTSLELACLALEKLLAGPDPLDGVFAHSDELGLCAARTLQQASKSAFVVGIGASDAAIQAVKNGSLYATIGQYPYEMGVIAMETTIEYLYGKPVEPDKPFPVNVITKDSIK